MVSAAATDYGLRTTDECLAPSSTASSSRSRTARHYVLRTAYLGTLWVVGLTAYQTIVGWTHSATLGETAHFGAVLFQLLTGLMLALFLFFSALSAASSVAREKDRRTFVLLLMTDLRNSEIVLGKVSAACCRSGYCWRRPCRC